VPALPRRPAAPPSPGAAGARASARRLILTALGLASAALFHGTGHAAALAGVVSLASWTAALVGAWLDGEAEPKALLG
jgi:hypothetical protein